MERFEAEIPHAMREEVIKVIMKLLQSANVLKTSDKNKKWLTNVKLLHSVPTVDGVIGGAQVRE